MSGFGEGGWIGESNPLDNYNYDNHELKRKLRAETEAFCEASEKLGSAFAALTVFFSWFGRKELPDPDVIEGELYD